MKDNRNHLRFVSQIINRVKLFVALAAFGMASTVVAQSQQAANSKPATTQAVSSPGTGSPDNQRYRIGAGDLLDIHILNRPNLSRDSVRVDGSGMIRMPLIDNDIQAACKSEGELAKEISKGYLRYYRN